MTGQVHFALAMAAWAVLMGQVSLVQLASGRASIVGTEFEARRDAAVRGFWFAWSTTIGIAALLVFVVAREAWRIAQASSTTAGDPKWDWLAVAIAGWMLVAWSWGRSGLPHTQWRDARARWRLRQRFVALTSDRTTGLAEISFDDLLDLGDKEWLEEILVHLGVQSEPRNLAQAIRDTDDAPAAPST